MNADICWIHIIICISVSVHTLSTHWCGSLLIQWRSHFTTITQCLMLSKIKYSLYCVQSWSAEGVVYSDIQLDLFWWMQVVLNSASDVRKLFRVISDSTYDLTISNTFLDQKILSWCILIFQLNFNDCSFE